MDIEADEAQYEELQTGRMLYGVECAGWSPVGGQCCKRARIECQTCRLVAYCSEECKASHAERHNVECPPRSTPPSTSEPVTEIPDHPIFDTGVFWANYAATDILNLAENEGEEYDGPLRILLMGPFGLRHLVYSLNAMPPTASPSLDVSISEMERPHLFRTFLSLLIIFLDGGEDPFYIATIVVHVWYSYQWPEYVLDYICENVSPLLADLSHFVKSHYANPRNSKLSSLGVRWGNPDYLHLQVFLDFRQWTELLQYAGKLKFGDTAQLVRTIDEMAYGEPLDRAFARMTPSRVAAMRKWRSHGILIPHGDCASPYQRPNPMFESISGRLPGGVTNEPLSEWPMNEILDYDQCPPKEDVYGRMFVYVCDQIASFQLRLRKRGIRIKLMAHGTTDIAAYVSKYFQETPNYDRIEVGHLFDIHPQLCLLTCSLLLRHEDENPFATMLTMTRDSVVQSGSPGIENHLAAEKHGLYNPAFASLDALVPPAQAIDGKYTIASVPRHLALLLYRNWDLFSDRYLNDANVFGFPLPENAAPGSQETSRQPKRSVLQTGYLGLQWRPKNRVTSRWPNRLVFGKDSSPTKEQVMRWMGWSTTKPERWLEWKKVRDVSYKEWLEYYAMIEGQDALRDWKSLYASVAAEEEDEDDEDGTGNVEKAEVMSTNENKAGNNSRDGAVDENAAPGKANGDENEDWMVMDTESKASQQDGKSKKKKKKKAKK